MKKISNECQHYEDAQIIKFLKNIHKSFKFLLKVDEEMAGQYTKSQNSNFCREEKKYDNKT